MLGRYFTLLLLICLSTSLSAQSRILTGKVVEKNSKEPIEFATVAVKNVQDSTIVTGVTTDMSGNFQIDVPSSDVFVTISFIGMKTLIVENAEIINSDFKLGILQMGLDDAALEEVVITGEKSQTVFKLDKRIFNVGTDLSSTGASALEVLNNVPSVTVDIEGQVSLRGSSGVQMLINGKPSVLASADGNALGTITADMIERIEVITNPSAKYDAEGTSGILNIVLKKEEKRGLNGSVSLNTGYPNNHSIGVSLNRRTEKFNLFSQFGYGYRTYPMNRTSDNYNNLIESLLITNGENERNEQFYNITLGTDYHINDNNVITLSGNFAYEIEEEEGTLDYELLQMEVRDSWQRIEETEGINPKWEYELQYKKDFDSSDDKSLLFSALGSSFAKDKSSYFDILNTNAPNERQNADTEFNKTEFTFKLDYTDPITDMLTIEAGSQYNISQVSNEYEVNDYIDENWVQNAALSNIFDFDQKVLAIYTTLALEIDKWGAKAGLRMENTQLETFLLNSEEKNDIKYTDYFPSAHISYTVSKALSFQGGYSRRIYRPRMWDLNPFFSFSDNFHIYSGNPNINPEYTQSFEITSISILGPVSMNAGVYHRRTEDVIERVTSFNGNVSSTMPENIGTKNITGVELNAKMTATKWLSLSTDLNYNSFVRNGEFENNSFDFNGDQWTGRLMTKWKLPKDWAFELSGNFRSSYKTIQGTYGSATFADLGIRKKMLKGKAVISASVRDIFASRIRRFIIDQPEYQRESEYKRGRFITLGFSYGFGKGEAMEYSGGGRHR